MTKESGDGCIEQLTRAGDYFARVLPQYEEAACWHKKLLTNELLSFLGKKYLQNPKDQLLECLHFCESNKQINAGYILHELGFEVKSLLAYVLNPALVFAISELKLSGLAPCIEGMLTNGKKCLALIGMHKLGNFNWRKASLILFAQNQLTTTELNEFIASCKIFPKLASLVIKLHDKKFLAPQLKQLAFDSSLHQAAQLLLDLNIEFNFVDLSPAACQLMGAIADLIKSDKEQESINNYLKTVLPAILQYFNQEIELDTCLSVIQKQNSLFTDTETEESALGMQLSRLFAEQLHVFATALKVGVPAKQQLMKTRFIADELGQAVRLLDTLFKDENFAKSVTDGEKAAFYNQLFAGFSALPADCQLAAKNTTTGSQGFNELPFAGASKAFSFFWCIVAKPTACWCSSRTDSL